MQPVESFPRPNAGPVWLRLPTFRPRAAGIMLAVLVAIFIYEVQRAGGDQEVAGVNGGKLLLDLGAKDNDLIIKGEYWRLITAMFLHADLLHIAFNGYALYLFGDQIERFYGWARFLAIYFVAGLAGSIASFAFSPYDSVGASGAIFGLIGALGAFFYVHRRLLGAMARTQLWNAVVLAGLNLLLGLGAGAGAIDNFAHGGGFIGGIVAAVLLVPRYRPGRALAPDERLLEDAMPRPLVPAMVIAMLAVEVLLFALALALQGGAIG
ncbi:MAG: rhomboid family intramembrane serine protease [Chloroflexia bacterium]